MGRHASWAATEGDRRLARGRAAGQDLNLYVETSAALRAILGGESEDGIRAILAQEYALIGASRLTIAEVGRVLARLRVTSPEAAAIASRREAIFTDAVELWTIHPIDEEILLRCARSFPVEPVRTLDAIHLATIERLGRSLGELTVLSTDDRVRDNSTAFGFRVRP